MSDRDRDELAKLRCTDGVFAVYRPHPIVNPWHCYNTKTGEFIEARTDEQVAKYHKIYVDYRNVTVTPEQIETAIAPRPCGDFVGDGMRCDQPKGHDGRHSNRNW